MRNVVGSIINAMMLASVLLALSACDGVDKSTRRRDWVDAEIAKRGYAEVGKTPDGKPLYMKYIDVGFEKDRVYFTDASISAVENCGKSCKKTVVSEY